MQKPLLKIFFQSIGVYLKPKDNNATPCIREAAKVFDGILIRIAGKEKVARSRFIICSDCWVKDKEDRGFRNIGEEFEPNDNEETCHHLFGNKRDRESHSINRIWPAKVDDSIHSEGEMKQHDEY